MVTTMMTLLKRMTTTMIMTMLSETELQSSKNYHKMPYHHFQCQPSLQPRYHHPPPHPLKVEKRRKSFSLFRDPPRLVLPMRLLLRMVLSGQKTVLPVVNKDLLSVYVHHLPGTVGTVRKRCKKTNNNPNPPEFVVGTWQEESVERSYNNNKTKKRKRNSVLPTMVPPTVQVENLRHHPVRQVWHPMHPRSNPSSLNGRVHSIKAQEKCTITIVCPVQRHGPNLQDMMKNKLRMPKLNEIEKRERARRNNES
mmetsp:Transcript_27737/g.39001  ORF Transcript_27737/g.39001 Transcript_27737/m.39001 type:complete len:252 (+) Transcript_27737:915-1670(+)